MNKSKEPDIQDIIKRGAILSKKIYKTLTKNSTFGKNYKDIMELKERLETEEKQKEQKTEAIKVINQIKKKRQEEALQRKLARRAKILRFLHIGYTGNQINPTINKKLDSKTTQIFAFSCSTLMATIFVIVKHVTNLLIPVSLLCVLLWCVFFVLIVLRFRKRKENKT